MKEIWKKSGLFYKLIAIMLTVVMVGTSLYFHFDRKYSAKAATIISMTKAYLPAGGNDGEYGTETGWQPVGDEGTVGVGDGRRYAYILRFDQMAYDVECHKSTYALDEWHAPNNPFYYDGKQYYCFIISAYDVYNIKFRYKETSEGEYIETEEVSAFTWTDASTKEINASITRGDTVTNIAEGESYYIKKNDELTVNVVTTSAPGQLTTYSVWNENVDVSQFATATPDPQSLLYTYTFIKTFDDDNAVNTAMTTGNSISATVGGTPLTINCDYAYDATTPTIAATLGNSTGSVYNVAYDEGNTDLWYGSAEAPINSVQFEASSGSGTSESNLAAVIVDNNNVLAGDVTSYSYPKALVEGVNTAIVISATDLAGNTSGDKTYTFKIDNTAPVVDDTLTVGGYSEANQYVGLNAANDVTIAGTTSDLCANDAAGSGVEKVYIEIKKSNDTDLCVNKEFTANADGSYSISLTDFPEIDATNLANGIYDADGYKVIVTAKDKVGNVSVAKELTFNLDVTKPAITATLERHATGAADDEWEQVLDTDVDTASNTYFVNGVTYDKLRYKIEVTEANPADTEPVTIKKTDDSSASVGALTNDLGIYYYTISSSDLSTAEALSLKAVVKDKSNNENVSDNQLLLPKLQLVDADIKVELLEVWCDGEKIADATSLTDLKTDFNSQYTIKVIAKSGFAITELELRKGDETPAYASIPAADIGDSVDSMGIHTTSSNEFTLPSGTENEAFGSLKIYVKNSNNDTKEVPIGDLLYDHTDPFVKIVDKATGTSVDYTKWYQDITVGYEIKSGSSAVEANLDSVKYTVDGQENILTPSGITLTGDIAVSESTSTTGTNVTFDVKDKATNSMPASAGIFNIKVDKTAPQVSTINLNGEAVTESTVLAGTPSVTSKVTDNLTINNYVIAVKYNGEDYASSNVIVNKDGSEQNILYNLDQIINGKEIKDGKYTISIVASDKSGRTSNVSSTSFVIDNTAPVVTANITSGTSGKKNGYYNSDVTVRLTCTDNNFNPNAMTVTDNGSEVGVSWKTGNDMYYADITLSSEGIHDIRVSGKDKAGTAAVAKQVSFVIDKTEPTVSILLNGGQTYSESRGTLNLTGPLTINASVNDSNVDSGDLRVQVIKTVPDTATTTSEYLPTSERTFTFSDEADYVVNIYAVDKANNQGPTRTISFRVDTTAPQLTITGANGGTSAGATSVSFNITEAFWSDAKGTVEIYRKAGDGVDEVLYKTLTVSPTQRAYSLSELLNESGIYRFEFTAEDKVGHTATTSQKITVDRNKPEITLTGVKNYDSTDGAVSIAATIADEFYANKKVNISGTRIDATGKKTALSFSPYAATANPTTINDTFTEEGIYDITISATDIAGNVASNSVHFTIDTSAPIIGDLSKYDGKTFNKIDLDIDLDELVSDLTVCDVRMYLNGSEYDGISDIEDGSYTLLITAEDELGHTSEKSVTFVLDTKEPIFIVTGVEDGEIRNDTYSIEVSLQLDEDTLDSVTLNDESVLIKNNVASINVTDKGEYELYMKAYDEAGNEAEQTITFTFGEESVATVVTNAVEKAASHWWMWAIVVAAIFAVGGFIFFILKRKKDNE